ncbi:hypothetical protein CMU25_17365 [Elizabethkingia anophelis]|nr:hypothetical protein [Elizabethkingia anophelis]MDV3842092.1 hypothetical protein [Elizabethkingia anophelis]
MKKIFICEIIYKQQHIMKRKVYIISILLIMIQCSMTSSEDYVSEISFSTKEIKKILQEEEFSWNKGDAMTYSLHFAQDGMFTNILGQYFVGHTQFFKRHEEIFKGVFKGSRMSQNIVSLKFINRDVVVVEMLIQISELSRNFPFKGVYIDEKGVLKTRLLQIFRKEKNEWKIVAYHNVDIKDGIKVS